MKGRLAQLVQSICLTSRGSAVRIRQRPPFINKKHFGRLAQLVQSICLTSRGSAVRIRQRPPFINKKHFGRLAQLVQSICLTSRGSAVRIRQRPQKESSFTLLFLFPPPQTNQKKIWINVKSLGINAMHVSFTL